MLNYSAIEMCSWKIISVFLRVTVVVFSTTNNKTGWMHFFVVFLFKSHLCDIFSRHNWHRTV